MLATANPLVHMHIPSRRRKPRGPTSTRRFTSHGRGHAGTGGLGSLVGVRDGLQASRPAALRPRVDRRLPSLARRPRLLDADRVLPCDVPGLRARAAAVAHGVLPARLCLQPAAGLCPLPEDHGPAPAAAPRRLPRRAARGALRRRAGVAQRLPLLPLRLHCARAREWRVQRPLLCRKTTLPRQRLRPAGSPEASLSARSRLRPPQASASLGQSAAGCTLATLILTPTRSTGSDGCHRRSRSCSTTSR